MYAAHFAAGLAIKSRAPKTPAWALLVGAFVPDLLWIGFSFAGIEPASQRIYFDDWSHSLASIAVEATLFSLVFFRAGAAVCFPVWLAVFSHFLLDLPIHPRPLALFPHSSIHVGPDLWAWGLSKSLLGATNYWWIQLGSLIVLLAIYIAGARKAGIALNLAAASCLAVFGLHLLF
ncbi:MAG TPA: hypothetical protein VGL35_13470 [Rhizomicrobium sp.]|jgi:hypothetical protein